MVDSPWCCWFQAQLHTWSGEGVLKGKNLSACIALEQFQNDRFHEWDIADPARTAPWVIQASSGTGALHSDVRKLLSPAGALLRCSAWQRCDPQAEACVSVQEDFEGTNLRQLAISRLQLVYHTGAHSSWRDGNDWHYALGPRNSNGNLPK